MLWLLVGGVTGILLVLSAWSAVTHLQPRAPQRSLKYALGSGILRCVLAAGILAAVFRRGFGPGTLALVGMWLGRWGGIWWLHVHRRPSGRWRSGR